MTTAKQLLPSYSFDSGAIINGRRDIFIPTTFGPVWTQIEGMIATGQVRAVDEVKYEIAKKDDDASKWARAQKSLFVPLEEDIQRATREVLAAHPRLLGIGGGPRNGADAFVNALALVSRCSQSGTSACRVLCTTRLRGRGRARCARRDLGRSRTTGWTPRERPAIRLWPNRRHLVRNTLRAYSSTRMQLRRIPQALNEVA